MASGTVAPLDVKVGADDADPCVMSQPSIRPAPTEVEHPVGADELLFSTTDHRGIIRTGNNAFARVSGHPIDELIGAPHNLVRHPAMPAGVFELMWERLEQGRPMAAYVRNMAADGATYWVFATITSFGDGFLSVRFAPLTPVFDVVTELYATVREHEHEHAAAGHHRGEVARFGAAFVEGALQHMGFPSYDDFMYEALAVEIAARRERSVR